jgi:hypothetical protein
MKPHPYVPKAKFRSAEDERLMEAIRLHDTINWLLVAVHLPDRNTRQCRERWNNYANPRLVITGWTNNEDALLIQKYNEFGPKW